MAKEGTFSKWIHPILMITIATIRIIDNLVSIVDIDDEGDDE